MWYACDMCDMYCVYMVCICYVWCVNNIVCMCGVYGLYICVYVLYVWPV